MVDFLLKIKDNQVPKWSSHYVDYERLDALLKKICRLRAKCGPAAPDSDDDDDDDGCDKENRWAVPPDCDSVAVTDHEGEYDRDILARRPSWSFLSERPGGHLSRSNSRNSLGSLGVLSELSGGPLTKSNSRNSLSSPGRPGVHADVLRAIGKLSESTLRDRQSRRKLFHRPPSTGSLVHLNDVGLDVDGDDVGTEMETLLPNYETPVVDAETPVAERRPRSSSGGSAAERRTRSSSGGSYGAMTGSASSSNFMTLVRTMSDAGATDSLRRVSHSFTSLLGLAGPEKEAADAKSRRDKYETAHQEFKTFLYTEISRVESFYAQKIVEYSMRLSVLLKDNTDEHHCDIEAYHGPDDQYGEPEHCPEHAALRDVHSIQRAMVDIHREAALLANFAIMNYTAFVHVLRKHDMFLPEETGHIRNVYHGIAFVQHEEATRLTDSIERLFAEKFCHGNMVEARLRLLPQQSDDFQMSSAQFRFAHRLGMCFVLLLWVVWSCIWGYLNKESSKSLAGEPGFRVFRCAGALLVFHWTWGLSVYLWNMFGINYIFLLEFDPRHVRAPLEIMNECVDDSLVYLICILLFYNPENHIPQNILPTGSLVCFIFVYTIWRILFPWKIRRPIWRTILRILRHPLSTPAFFTIFVSDVLTSFSIIFQDAAWSVVFFVSGDFMYDDLHDQLLWYRSFWFKRVAIPLIQLIPLWVRLAQSLRMYYDTGKKWPHLGFAFDWALGQMVTIFGCLHPVYTRYTQKEKIPDYFGKVELSLIFFSAMYGFLWDVRIDWGLGQFDHGGLAHRLMLPNRAHYYVAIAVDFVLRFLWVSTRVPPSVGLRMSLPGYLKALSITAELVRRAIWCTLLLEHEHRENTMGYRRVSFVPLHFSSEKNTEKEEKKSKSDYHLSIEVCIVVSAIVASSVIGSRYALGDG
mmetsp:Transcript_15468/g.30821  ORF Transcript_15468/g.30821 Transcript_15468/m.30821 type:complete len:917 (+) Transcript_15468:218-2968(+)